MKTSTNFHHFIFTNEKTLEIEYYVRFIVLFYYLHVMVIAL